MTTKTDRDGYCKPTKIDRCTTSAEEKLLAPSLHLYVAAYSCENYIFNNLFDNPFVSNIIANTRCNSMNVGDFIGNSGIQ